MFSSEIIALEGIGSGNSLSMAITGWWFTLDEIIEEIKRHFPRIIEVRKELSTMRAAFQARLHKDYFNQNVLREDTQIRISFDRKLNNKVNSNKQTRIMEFTDG